MRRWPRRTSRVRRGRRGAAASLMTTGITSVCCACVPATRSRCRTAPVGGAGPGSAPRSIPSARWSSWSARRPSITVAFAPVKGDRPEWVVQKLTELGVDRIVAHADGAIGRAMERRPGGSASGAPAADQPRGGDAVAPVPSARGCGAARVPRGVRTPRCVPCAPRRPSARTSIARSCSWDRKGVVRSRARRGSAPRPARARACCGRRRLRSRRACC